jgi:hypothetical protein
MLGAWERGLQEGPVERGLTLLALASPDDPGTLAALSIGERNRQLLALREALFGDRISALASCPRCGEALELELTARQLLAAAPTTDALAFASDGGEVRLRLPDSRDLLAAAQAPPERAAAVLLERCLVSAHAAGAPVAADGLPEQLVDEAGRRLAEADPQADVRFALTCPACAHAWSAPFDVVQYLWAEVDAWAGRTLADVHALACAYGWTESEILRLSPARRESYLRMVGE